jgi:hypothetical protein
MSTEPARRRRSLGRPLHALFALMTAGSVALVVFGIVPWIPR